MNIIDKLKVYINNNLEVNAKKCFSRASTDYDCCITKLVETDSSIENYIDVNKSDNKFQTLLFRIIDEKGLKDSDVYNKVHIDRRLFSKIRSDVDYHPSKETVLLLGLALEVSEDEIIALLESASYSLPKNNVYDLIIRFCFIEKIYDVISVNQLLDNYNCKLLAY